MQQNLKVKFFSRTVTPKLSFLSKPMENLDCGMENEINRWLGDNPQISAMHIKQTMSGGSWAPAKLIVSVWYEEHNREEGHK